VALWGLGDSIRPEAAQAVRRGGVKEGDLRLIGQIKQ